MTRADTFTRAAGAAPTLFDLSGEAIIMQGLAEALCIVTGPTDGRAANAASALAVMIERQATAIASGLQRLEESQG